MTKYLIWLLFVILPLTLRFLIVYNFKKWTNEISKKHKVEPSLINDIANKYNVEDNKIFQSKKEVLLSSFYTLVFFGITIWFWNNDTQLKKYRTETTATVYQINSNIIKSFALLKYEVKNKTYTTSIQIQQGNGSSLIYYGTKHIKVKIGQKFKIIYSSKNPNINEIVSEYPIE